MARPLRIAFPGAFYHVTARGNERKTVFKRKRDRERFLEYLETASERYHAVIHAYCLMDNHIHLHPVRAKMVEQPEQYEWTSYRIGK